MFLVRHRSIYNKLLSVSYFNAKTGWPKEVTRKCQSYQMDTKQPTGPNVFLSNCLSRQVLELIGGQWTTLVIYCLEDGTLRFGQLLKKIDGISRKVLTQTLRDLERNGIVERVVYPVVPPVVEYSLTPLGQTLIESVNALRTWAYAHLSEVSQAREAYDSDDHAPIQDEVATIVQQR
jgi:DNA-binding HxlR family transcriptional regulator